MRGIALLLPLLVGGCSSVLGIHPLSDADVDDPDGDAAMRDGGTTDAPIDSPVDAKPDAMPDAAATVQIGEYAVLASMVTIPGNYIIARRFTVGGTTVITAAGAYLYTETANGHIKFAIYSDNASSPYTRRVTTTTDITLDGNGGYNEAPLGPHTLQAGTYWMVMATDAAVAIGSLDTNNVTSVATSLPYSGAFPTAYNPQPPASTMGDRVNLYLQAQP